MSYNITSQTDRVFHKRRLFHITIRITAIYMLAGLLWILLTDCVMSTMSSDIQTMARISLYKGWLFVLATSIFMFFIVQLFMRQIYRSELQLLDNKQELELAYEELTANEEELREQYVSLQNKADALYASEENYRSLFNNMLNAFALHQMICDPQGNPVDYRFLDINPAFERATGLSRDQVIGKTVLEVMPDTEQYWIDTYGQVALSRNPVAFIQYARELDRYFQVEAYSPTRGLFATQFLDVTDTKRRQDQIEYMAYHDDLTGLPNRAEFRRQLEATIHTATQQQSKFALLFLDLNDFKLVNDTLGHIAGDELLQDIAHRLTSCVRQQDVVARMGGDEFTILLPDTYDPESITRIANKIMATVQEPWQYSGKQIRATVKIGIALFPDDGQDANRLMKCADIAMYNAKQQGQGYLQYYRPHMEPLIAKRMEIETDLHQALENNQFVLFYQPQVDFNRKIIGMEALLRWQHPTRGTIPPLDFIPIAEESGLILRIGEWVLRSACQQNRLWQQMGLPPITVAVNLSARQFQQHDLTEMVTRELREANLDPHYLALEITETVAMNNAEFTIQVLQALKAQNIQIALDDFGVGYSSFNYLKRLPIDVLKIDRSFIQDINENTDSAIIVETMISLAQHLQLDIIAEGVETIEQMNYLSQLHCQYMQGYLFSRPLPVAEITRLLQTAL